MSVAMAALAVKVVHRTAMTVTRKTTTEGGRDLKLDRNEPITADRLEV